MKVPMRRAYVHQKIPRLYGVPCPLGYPTYVDGDSLDTAQMLENLNRRRFCEIPPTKGTP